MKTCKNCGAIMGDHMHKCNSCGALFEEPIRLELESETYVKPPEFPEDFEPSNEITLTLEPDTNVPSSESTDYSEPPIYPDPPKFPDDPDEDIVPASYENPKTETSAGGRVNLTQQAIDEHKQRRKQEQEARNGFSGNQKTASASSHSHDDRHSQETGTFHSGSNRTYSTSGSSYRSSGGGSVTGTPGLICGLIGLILVVVFGAIGSCTGVGAGSLVLTLIGLILCIIGLVISGNDRKATGNTCERANIAFVLSIIGIIIGAVLLLIGISCVGCIGCIGCAAANAIIN